MALGALMIQVLSFYLLYNTSKRAVLRTDKLSIWLQQHLILSTVAGLLLLIGSFILFVIDHGFAVGLFAGFLSLMITASLTVVLAPLYLKNQK